MFFHIRIFLQTLRRNVTYTAINIAGLSIGITASVLIFLWVHHERSFDTHHADTNRIYRIIQSINVGDNTNTFPFVSFPFISACETEIPEIENIAFTIISERLNSVTVNNTVFSVDNGVFVNRAWLEMFHNQILDGSFEAYGAHPYSVALSESEAKKYFGEKRAVGQTVRINNADYTVQAVVKDNPSNSNFRHKIMASTDVAMANPSFRPVLEQFGTMGINKFQGFCKISSKHRYIFGFSKNE